MDKTIYIIIGCDTDPDRSGFLDDLPNDTLSWQGMLKGIPIVKEKLKGINDSFGSEAVFTWCLRADYQIKKVHGSYNSVLKQNKEFLLELEQGGDELGWHPHFWKDDDKGNWYQEFVDTKWQVQMLKDAHKSFMEILPDRARSVRMGWDYHNTSTFGTLEELGITVDFSGIPGLKINPKNESIRSVNFFDWSLAPNNPYFPSRNDYRRVVKGDEAAFTLLESPNLVSRSLIWGMISGLVLAKKMKDIKPLINAIRRPTYWINVTGKPKLFAPIINQAVRSAKNDKNVFLVTYFHPDELLENKSKIYSADYLVRNVTDLINSANRRGIKTKFIPASDIRKYL